MKNILIVVLSFIFITIMGCKKTIQSDNHIQDANVESQDYQMALEENVSTSYFTDIGGKWSVTWKQIIMPGINGPDTTTVSIPYSYSVVGTYTVSCQGNVYDTTIYHENTFHYERVRFLENDSAFNFSQKTTQYQPVSYQINCSGQPQVYTLPTFFDKTGSWSYDAINNILKWQFDVGPTGYGYPFLRISQGVVEIIDNNKFFLTGTEQDLTDDPQTLDGPLIEFKYLIERGPN